MKPKLLVVELWGLGDLIIATPFLQAASEKYAVTLLAKPYAEDLQLRFWPEVKKAVEDLFKVKVAEVRLFNVRGKVKRQGRYAGKRRDWRKAYVRLKEGEKAPNFIEGV